MQGQEPTHVRFEIPEYKRVTHENVDGCNVTVQYDSSFGGTQTVEGEAEMTRELENGRFRRYMVVGDRKVGSHRVYSTKDGRMLGKIESVTVTMDTETAIEWVAKDWNGHDVDTHDNEVYVQFWSGELDDEMSQEEWMNHTDGIRFKHA